MKNLTLLFLIVSYQLFAQQGDFLLTHHFPTHSNIDNSNFEIISDNNGMICLANRAGVLQYDGDTWDFFPTPSASLSLAVDDNNTLYVGSIGKIGKLEIIENKMSFESLMDKDSLDDLFLQTVYLNNRVHFLGNHHLITYDIIDDKTSVINGDYLNIFVLDDEAYVNSLEETFKLDGDSLVPFNTKIKVGSYHYRENRPELIVDFNGELFVWDDNRAKKTVHSKIIEDNGYEILQAKWINDSLIACSTYSSGVLLLNYNSDKYFDVIDYHSGLPDNEIYALHTDAFSSVWIAHPFGLTSASPLFPAYSFSHFPGLKGSLTGVFQEDNKLWVTTSLGLFHFDRDTTFKNKVYYTRVKTRAQPKQQPTASSKKKKEQKKKGLGGLFSKKNRASKEKEKKGGIFKSIAKGLDDVFSNPDNVEKISSRQAKSGQYRRRVRKIPVKINYQFSQVPGTDGKYFDLIKYQDHLLLVGNTGIYEVTPKESHLIISDNVREATVLSNGKLLVSTAELELKTFSLAEDIWVEEVTEPLDDIIFTIKEDSKGRVWLAGSSKVYEVNVTDTTLLLNESYALNNRFLDNVDILERNDTIYFVNSQGFFYYNGLLDSVIHNGYYENKVSEIISTIDDPSGKGVWVFNGKNWFSIQQDGPIKEFEYFGLFKDIISISEDGNSKDYWLLTKDQLLKYDPEKDNVLSSHNLFVRQLSSQRGVIDKSEKFTLSYDENFLTVELSKPDFLGLLDPEFQYKLEGLHENWSEWTKSKSIDFSYLPPGQYALKVRSRDAFGRTEEGQMLEFKVSSPYWQQPWFYAIQILFFGALVVVSTRLNQSNSANRLLSGALSVLTLVLIIEFIQSAAGILLNIASTPVVDFLLDVFVALLIFPLENLLRKILSAGETQTKAKVATKKS